MFGHHQRWATFPQAQQDHVDPGHGPEVRTAEAVNNGHLEPREQQRANKRPPRLAHQTLRSFALDNQVRVLGRAGWLVRWWMMALVAVKGMLAKTL